MRFKLPAVDRRSAALAVLLTGAFMALLDFFIVFVATPSIGADLPADSAQLEWIVAGYSLVFALGLISGGRLGDLHGRRRVFRYGLAAFAVGSALCGVAPSAETLIAARVVQALGAAALMPQVLSIIQVEFAPHERGRALALMGAVQGLAAVSGQLVGGALIELDVLGLGWRSIFLVNVPIAAIALVAAGRFVPESRAVDARRLDLGGVGLALLAVGALVFPLVEGRSAGWPWWAFAMLAAAAPLTALFVAWERRVQRRGGAPLVVLELFALAPFRRGVALSLLVFTGMPGLFLSITIYLQGGLGLRPLSAGVAFVPIALAFAASSLTGARLSIAARARLLPFAAAAVAAGVAGVLVVVAAAGDPSPLALAPFFAVFGAGQGLVVPGLNGIVLAETPVAFAGSASGLLATAQQIGAALGVAITGTLFYGALGGATDEASYGDALTAAGLFVLAVSAVAAVLCLVLTRSAARLPLRTAPRADPPGPRSPAPADTR